MKHKKTPSGQVQPEPTGLPGGRQGNSQKWAEKTRVASDAEAQVTRHLENDSGLKTLHSNQIKSNQIIVFSHFVLLHRGDVSLQKNLNYLHSFLVGNILMPKTNS